MHQVSNESRASITESLSEFFDAQEVLLSASSSENEVSLRDLCAFYSEWASGKNIQLWKLHNGSIITADVWSNLSVLKLKPCCQLCCNYFLMRRATWYNGEKKSSRQLGLNKINITDSQLFITWQISHSVCKLFGQLWQFSAVLLQKRQKCLLAQNLKVLKLSFN